MNTDPRVTESVLAISVCKNPIRKTIHTEIAKIAKKGTNHGSKGHQSESVLETLAISVCKNPIRKTIYTEIAKKGTNHGSKGHQSESVLAAFAIPVCRTPIRKRNSHGDRKDRKERDNHGSKGHNPNPSQRSPCVNSALTQRR
jgi:hypothetical protein